MKVLIICFSNISKVASIVPLLDSLDRNYPQNEFWVLSRNFLSPLFTHFNSVTFVGADIRGEHKGLKGIFKLFRRLKAEKFDVVFDLQGNLRTQILFWLFKFSGVKQAFTINKHRKATRHLLKKGAIHYRQLTTIFEKYAETFAKAGLRTDDLFVSLPPATKEQQAKIIELYGKKSGKWIGFAPFSRAKGKTLPFRKAKNVIRYFDEQPNTKLFLFGAGEMENEMLSDWETVFNNVYAVKTALKLDEELALMSQLDVMISMDSANMHLAALTRTPVVSIWGETHPYAGFLGWKQSYDNCVGVSFSCRPCTEHSNKRCRYSDYRCLESIPSAKIIEKVNNVLKENH
ncbi:MAG: glycosyltransferase family 9 protein [Paludibacteraceae bacterium]|jgi:ADP-heptose:LPS heptosyltransferase|nr:glycosyltransferase family 9 protein [Paludibacteraceae bacterium]MBP9038820.1 glycosyltransferase family 9 protein [Paludibacteraceae bacterium]HOG35765.1 glycosyltransferase family 9 protein [Paludibacteraceae bacterium]HOS36619.1 glycosyltransferase family 9 protein [Paludibacteraceae bacterium]HPB84277.1 glycosyltransferase family 9 protein [Paludibacteraceae bacterium]